MSLWKKYIQMCRFTLVLGCEGSMKWHTWNLLDAAETQPCQQEVKYDEHRRKINQELQNKTGS